MPDPVTGSIGAAIGSKIIDFGMGQLGNMISGSQALSNYRHIYENYTSPSAQVSALAKAGLNPAVAMGNQSPLLSGSDNIQLPENPFGVGTSSLSDIANFMNAKAQAKKAGAEVKNLDIDAQVKQFDFELSKVFSAPEKYAALTLAWKNVMLSDDEHSINEWKREKEKAMSQAEGHQRDILKKTLDNMDIQLEQENTQRAEDIKLTKEKQKTEGTMQSANRASARASQAAADLSGSQKVYQDIVNDIKESGKTFELESMIKDFKSKGKVADAQAEQALTMLRRYKKLNENDKNAAAEYLNYLWWYLKEEMPSLPVVPFLKLGK